MNVTSAIVDTVPISMFNKGLAGKIFEEVKQTGAKVVTKKNVAECILLSPDEYLRIMDEINDAKLLAIAEERLKHYDPDKLIPFEKVLEEFNITQEDLDKMEDVEFE